MRHKTAVLAAVVSIIGSLTCADVLRSSVTKFTAGIGGLSALDVARDGKDFIMVNDRGNLVFGKMNRDDRDDLLSLDSVKVRPLAGYDGLALGGSLADPEGIDWDGRDEVFISFEGRERVERYRTDGTALETLSSVPRFPNFHPNRGIEALARTLDGHLLITPERAAPQEAPLLVLAPDGWMTITDLRAISPLSPVGMDVGPDGLLYILFRGVGLFGFSSTIAVMDLRSGAFELLIENGPGQQGNLEGISVWRDRFGGLRLTLVSDNNQLPILRSDVVEYLIEPPGLQGLDAATAEP